MQLLITILFFSTVQSYYFFNDVANSNIYPADGSAYLACEIRITRGGHENTETKKVYDELKNPIWFPGMWVQVAENTLAISRRTFIVTNFDYQDALNSCAQLIDERTKNSKNSKVELLPKAYVSKYVSIYWHPVTTAEKVRAAKDIYHKKLLHRVQDMVYKEPHLEKFDVVKMILQENEKSKIQEEL